jgi:CRP-like cAMP-binding protein
VQLNDVRPVNSGPTLGAIAAQRKCSTKFESAGIAPSFKTTIDVWNAGLVRCGHSDGSGGCETLRALAHEVREMAKAPPFVNKILSALTDDDLRLLTPHLKPVDLPLRKHLETARRSIDDVYFPDSGFVSVVADGAPDQHVEVGMIGREGMTGLAVVLGGDQTPNETFVQNAGAGQRIPAAKLRKAMRKSSTLQSLLLLYAHTFLIQTSQTAKANARSSLEERLARWLLMAHDRLDTDELNITHEFLAVMLGVRRSGVTVALNLLERTALISIHRGVTTIVDRRGLKATANGAYGVSEAEYNRVFG